MPVAQLCKKPSPLFVSLQTTSFNSQSKSLVRTQATAEQVACEDTSNGGASRLRGHKRRRRLNKIYFLFNFSKSRVHTLSAQFYWQE